MDEPLLKFWISGPPVGRHLEVLRFGGHASIGHSAKSEKYLRRIRAKVRQEIGEEFTPLAIPVRVDLLAMVPMPQSWSQKRKRETDGTLASTKPDVDNIAKLALDGLVGTKDSRLALVDDTQVVLCMIERRYTLRESAGLSIAVFQIAIRSVVRPDGAAQGQL